MASPTANSKIFAKNILVLQILKLIGHPLGYLGVDQIEAGAQSF